MRAAIEWRPRPRRRCVAKRMKADRALSGILRGSRTLMTGTYRYRRAAFARARKSLDRIRLGTECLDLRFKRLSKHQSVRTEATDADEPLTAVPTEYRSGGGSADDCRLLEAQPGWREGSRCFRIHAEGLE